MDADLRIYYKMEDLEESNLPIIITETSSTFNNDGIKNETVIPKVIKTITSVNDKQGYIDLDKMSPGNNIGFVYYGGQTENSRVLMDSDLALYYKSPYEEIFNQTIWAGDFWKFGRAENKSDVIRIDDNDFNDYIYYLWYMYEGDYWWNYGNINVYNADKNIYSRSILNESTIYSSYKTLRRMIPLDIKNKSDLKIETTLESVNSAGWYYKVYRKEIEPPEIVSTELITNSTVGDNTKIRYKITTKHDANRDTNITATLNGINKSLLLESGNGDVVLEWDTSELGQGDIKTITIEAKISNDKKTTKIFDTDLNIRYTLKNFKTQLLTQVPEKHNQQRFIMLNGENRMIDNNVENQELIKELIQIIKTRNSYPYIISGDNLLFKNLAKEFE